MPFFQYTICKDNGSPVAKNVTVMLAETKPDDWYGTIRAAHLSDLAAGQLYVLKLEDGRTGEFLVRRNTAAGESDRAVAIHGMGMLE